MTDAATLAGALLLLVVLFATCVVFACIGVGARSEDTAWRERWRFRSEPRHREADHERFEREMRALVEKNFGREG